jgi:hypothetical protein
MSRGHGRWERAIVQAASTAVVVPVSGVVHATVVTPARADFTSARRAARTLATKSQVSALYTWTCPGCFAVQDRPDPVKCCERVRPMLSVTRPERRHLVRHPASPPGGSVPRWLSAAPAAPAGLAVPTVGDVAALALRRAYERLESGATISVQDVVALLKLAREVERDSAGAGSAARWERTLSEVLWVARRHLGDQWPAFAADIRGSDVLSFLHGPPPPRPAARL